MAGYIRKLFITGNSGGAQFIRYSLVGGIASAADISIFLLTAGLMQLDPILANSLSFSCGLLVNYFLSRDWVFKQNEHRFIRDFLIFAVIGVIGLALSNLILFILLERRVIYIFLAFLNEGILRLISKLTAVLIVLFWNFTVRRKLVFKI